MLMIFLVASVPEQPAILLAIHSLSSVTTSQQEVEAMVHNPERAQRESCFRFQWVVATSNHPYSKKCKFNEINYHSCDHCGDRPRRYACSATSTCPIMHCSSRLERRQQVWTSRRGKECVCERWNVSHGWSRSSWRLHAPCNTRIPCNCGHLWSSRFRHCMFKLSK